MLSCKIVRDYIRKVYNESEGPLERDLVEHYITGGIIMTEFTHDLKSEDVSNIFNVNIWGVFMFRLSSKRLPVAFAGYALIMFSRLPGAL